MGKANRPSPPSRFTYYEECEAVCSEVGDVSHLKDKCEQPIKEGPCMGNYTRLELWR